MKFIFWNINKNPLVDEIAELVEESKCDIAAFAETDEETMKKVIISLKEEYKIDCSLYQPPGCDRIKIIVIGCVNISLLSHGSYFSLVKIKGDNRELIAGFVNFPSKLHRSLDSLRGLLEKFHNQIIVEEVRCNIQGSMVMGDFNVNPFEMPMISLLGMGATNGQYCSQRNKVTSDDVSKRLFYNPMWTLYAEHKERPGGYRYLDTQNHVLTWHFLDQVIIRPSLIEYFNFDSLQVIKKTSTVHYLNNRQSPDKNISDHLPLMCEVEI